MSEQERARSLQWAQHLALVTNNPPQIAKWFPGIKVTARHKACLLSGESDKRQEVSPIKGAGCAPCWGRAAVTYGLHKWEWVSRASPSVFGVICLVVKSLLRTPACAWAGGPPTPADSRLGPRAPPSIFQAQLSSAPMPRKWEVAGWRCPVYHSAVPGPLPDTAGRNLPRKPSA